jgi:hypothetical protein
MIRHATLFSQLVALFNRQSFYGAVKLHLLLVHDVYLDPLTVTLLLSLE